MCAGKLEQGGCVVHSGGVTPTTARTQNRSMLPVDSTRKGVSKSLEELSAWEQTWAVHIREEEAAISRCYTH